MLNPLDVEQQYQNLLLSLSLPATSYQRLRAIGDFLTRLAGEEPVFESYLLDCLEHVPALVKELSRSGHDPDDVRRVYERLRLAVDSVRYAPEWSTVQNALGEIRQIVCGLYAYGAAWGTLCDMLGTRFPAMGSPEATSGGEPRHVTLRKMAEQSRDSSVRDSLAWLYGEWESSIKPQSSVAYVPVVERALGDEMHGAGSLRRLTVKIFGETEDGRDAIHGDLAVFGVNREETGLTHIPVQAARSVLKKIDVPLVEKHFDGRITFGNSHELHEGDSARLAAMTLLVCEAVRYANRRKQYRLRTDVALTGSLDSEGNVLDVDDESLSAKVNAAFFSHVETLVVPKGQVVHAEESLKELRVRYSARHMDIVGVGHSREIFYDRRVVEEVRLPGTVHLARSIARRKTPILAGVALVGLLFVIGRLLFGPIDKTPGGVEFVGNIMNIKNQYDEVVSSAPVDANTVAFQESQSKATKHLPPVEVMRDDGRDSDAVVFIGFSRLDAPAADEVRKWSITHQRYDWIWHPVPVVDFPRKNHEARGRAHLATLVAFADVDSSPGREILVVSHHPNSFPSVLTVLDRHSGSPISEYLHVGFINDIKIFDIDADGREEILLCGVNNAFRMAFLAVLDPRFVNGCSPTKGEYICASHARAREKHYVLIPRTVVGQTSTLWKNNAAGIIEIDQTTRRLAVRVEDSVGEDDSPGHPVRASLNYVFDSSMRVLNIAAGDDYDLLAERLVARGVLQKRPDNAYFEAEKTRLQYWHPDGWSSEP